MSKKKKIPLLKSNSYQQSYYSDDGNKSQKGSSYTLQHFEIDCRNKLQDAIKAHRLDFYLVFIVTGGEGVQLFGTQEYYLEKNMLCFVGPDMITSWRSQTDNHQGYTCSFSNDFFNLGREDKNFLRELPFFQIDGCSVLHLTDEITQDYLSLFKSMYKEYKHASEYSGNVLRAQLNLFLQKAYALYKTNSRTIMEGNTAALRLTKAFKDLYERDFEPIKNHRPISLKKIGEYAEQLGITQNHLNDTVKSVTGRSAGQLIKDRVIKQATMCLKQSQLNISEIAYLLGYEDPSYFSRYYKKQTGKTPSSVR